MRLSRRQYLTAIGASVSAVALAGCSGDDSSDSDGGNTNGGDDGSNGGDGGSNGGDGDSNGGDDGSNGGDGGSNGGDGDSNNQPDIELLDHGFYAEQFSSGVRGTAVNNTDSELSYVEAEAVFLDESGTQIGDGLDNVTDLAAGREWEFECMFLGSDADRIARYEIEVSTGL